MSFAKSFLKNPKYQSLAKEKKHKYSAERQIYNGEGFRSKLELNVYLNLKLLEKAKEIESIRREQSIEIIPGIKHKIDYIYYCHKRSTDVRCEAKGFEDATWREKLKLYRLFTDVPLEIWVAGSGDRVYIKEIIPIGKYKVVSK